MKTAVTVNDPPRTAYERILLREHREGRLLTCNELHEEGFCNLDWRKTGKCPNERKE